MDNIGIYVGLDIGTASIKIIVAENVRGQMNVIGVVREPSNGVNRGVIVDIDKAANAIRKAVDAAEKKANIQIHDVVAGIPANLLRIEPVRGMIAISDGSREIENQDVIDVASAASLHNLPPEQEVVDVLPDEFIVDGFDGIKDPRGMVGVRLEMNGNIITGPKTIIHNLRSAVTKAGLELKDIVVDSLALGKTILNDGEQDFGTITLDLGAGQSTVAVIHDHHLKYTFVEQEGGQFVTKDISVVLNTSLENAEQIKQQYGYAISEDAGTETFPVNVVGKNEPVATSQKYLSEIIEARLEQILTNIKKQLEKVGALDMPGGIVITGGAAAIPGIEDLVERIFETSAKLYVPDQMGLRHPAFSQILAIVNYESSMNDVDILAKKSMVANEMDVSENSNEKPISRNAKIKSNKTRTSSKVESHRTVQSENRQNNNESQSLKSRFSGIAKWFNDFFE